MIGSLTLRINNKDQVPTNELQRVFANTGLTAAQVARNLGWMQNPAQSNASCAPQAEGSRVKRWLGLLPYRNGNREWVYRRVIDADRAAILVLGMDLDPVDYDL